MTTETKPAQTGGDWDVRGLDYETFLVGAVTEAHIDADRLARREFDNGFPNWVIYRAVYCEDSLYFEALRAWCVAYAIAYCEAGGVRKGMPAEGIGCLAGWDAYYAMRAHKWLIAGMDVADVAGVDPKTYRKVRDHVYGAMQKTLRAYWAELGIAVRRWHRLYLEAGHESPRGAWNNGRGFAHEVGFPGDGCYVVKAAPLSDTL